MILGGDIGGTKTLLAIAEFHPDGPRIICEQRFASKEYPSFDLLLSEFLANNPTVESACFGLAGPTDGINARLTYLPWHLSSDALKRRFNFKSVTLVNDFAAAANGLPIIGPEQLQIMQNGKIMTQAPRIILGAGTGLGVAGMVWDAGCYKVIPGEGGHIGFSPQTIEQGELWHWLLMRNGRVTTEDIVSGPGLANIYAFLESGLHTGRSTFPMQSPENIGNAALNNTDSLAKHAVELWLSAFGAFAGDLALHWLSHGGVYLAGGIAAKLIPTFGHGIFVEAFCNKREHRAIAVNMPIKLVTEQRLGLLGALALAASSIR